jgi:hypothetical protein
MELEFEFKVEFVVVGLLQAIKKHKTTHPLIRNNFFILFEFKDE